VIHVITILTVTIGTRLTDGYFFMTTNVLLCDIISNGINEY